MAVSTGSTDLLVRVFGAIWGQALDKGKCPKQQ
jgi:hypothetical protein